MDTDSLPPLLTFIGFLALFAWLCLAENAGGNGGGLLREGAPTQRAWYVLAPLKYACVLALAVAGFYLAQDIPGLTGGYRLILALALLVGLTVIHRLAALLAQRRPALAAACSRPALALLRRGNGQARRPAAADPPNGNGSAAALETPPENLEITEAELENLDHRDRAMLRSIIRLDDTTAHEIMIPRLDMVALEVNTPLREAVNPIIQSGHTRIPVYAESIDHIIGIVHSLELLKHFSNANLEQMTLREVQIHPAYFIPENKRLDDLLEEIQQKAVQMAIVVDEYGGTEGLITMEDLLEEIVGEIEDEFSSSEEPEVAPQLDGSALVSAGVTTDVVEELFGIHLDNEDADTIGGYVYTTLGRMPEIGDQVETEQLSIVITAVRGRRIQRLHLHPKNRENGKETGTG